MEQYIIKGGNPLVGEVEIGGAKNAALAILAAAIMTDETVQIDNLPDVNDVNVMLEAIEGIGAMVQRIDRHTVKINGSTIGDFNIEYDYIKKIRGTDEEKKARTDKGVLFTSGLIAGEGITGILLAGFAVAKLDVALKFSLPQVGSLIIFIALLGGLFALCMKAKPAKK